MYRILVILSILSTIKLTFAGYSFEKQVDAQIPPDVTYPYTSDVGVVLETVAGVSGDAGDLDGPATSPSTTLTNPQFIWVDHSGVVYFTDRALHKIRAVGIDNSISTFAGTGIGGYNGEGAIAVNVNLFHPTGLSGDSNRVVVCDSSNFRLRAISLAGSNAVSTIVGSGVQGYDGDGTSALLAKLYSPYAVWVDEASNEIYFTELHKCTIRRVTADGKIYTIVGIAGQCTTTADGDAATITLNGPRAIFGDRKGFIYFTEFESELVRKYDTSTNGVITVAGGGADNLLNEGDGGLATDAKVRSPTSVWVDHDDNVYFTESYSSVVRKVSEGVISTVFGVHGVRGPFTKITTPNILYHPRGLYGDELVSLKIYLADTDNHRILSYSVPSLQPSSQPSSQPTMMPTRLVNNSNCISGDTLFNVLIPIAAEDSAFPRVEDNLTTSTSLPRMMRKSIPMSDLRVGDLVEVGDEEYEPILEFMHRETKTGVLYYQLEAKDGGIVELSDLHLIEVRNRGYRWAKDVRVGDEVLVHHQWKPIVNIRMITRRGSYSPYTWKGVMQTAGGIQISCFATLSGNHLFIPYWAWKIRHFWNHFFPQKTSIATECREEDDPDYTINVANEAWIQYFGNFVSFMFQE